MASRCGARTGGKFICCSHRCPNGKECLTKHKQECCQKYGNPKTGTCYGESFDEQIQKPLNKICNKGIWDGGLGKCVIDDLNKPPDTATYDEQGNRTNEDLPEADQKDCANFLGLQGIADPFCVLGKSTIKGAEGSIPIIALAVGAVIVLIMAFK